MIHLFILLLSPLARAIAAKRRRKKGSAAKIFDKFVLVIIYKSERSKRLANPFSNNVCLAYCIYSFVSIKYFLHKCLCKMMREKIC